VSVAHGIVFQVVSNNHRKPAAAKATCTARSSGRANGHHGTPASRRPTGATAAAPRLKVVSRAGRAGGSFAIPRTRGLLEGHPVRADARHPIPAQDKSRPGFPERLFSLCGLRPLQPPSLTVELRQRRLRPPPLAFLVRRRGNPQRFSTFSVWPMRLFRRRWLRGLYA
jgi:hypothetical protein